MKLSISLLILFLGLFSFELKAQVSKDYTVQAWAVVNKTKPSITIKWQKLSTGVTGYNIYRKGKTETSWGTIKGTKSATDTMWTDTTVTVGVAYEYNIQKMNGATVLGFTYLLSGIEIPAVHNRGNVFVVVEKTLSDSITNELNAYYLDLASDGWKVYKTVVNKTDSIQKVKRLIKNMNVQCGGLKSLIILGHVPVPYSGNFAPDGHPDHAGCWPTDNYYTIDYDYWTDATTNSSGITRNENKNLPGDGKWDENYLPGLAKYYTGRIDLSNMSKFSKNEIGLTKQYLKKDHDFRFKITKTVEKGVIDENFSASLGAFASTGWRNFSVMFGPKNIVEQDYLTTCRKENVLFGYGCGGGSYQTCDGVGTTDSFTVTKGAIFNMLFGSYFGDWDNANNLLRAPLASAQNGLTNAWSGRPYWENHPMALGEPIGYCAMITQNNQGTYSDNIYANTMPIGLMGDPTLRLQMVSPPTNITASAVSNNSKVKLTWTASKDANTLGYYVYRSTDPLNNLVPINNTPITDTTYTDNTPYLNTNYYLVKSVYLTTSASGSYYNLSQGNAATISGIVIKLNISGTVYNDGNGLTEATPLINGTGIGTPSSIQLYAYLADNNGLVIDKVSIPSNGTYSLSGADANTTYTVRLSSVNVAIGTTVPSLANLPTDWVSTGENLGTGNTLGSGNETGTPNCQISVKTGSGNISGVDFGIQKISLAHNKSYYSLNTSAFNASSGNSTFTKKIALNATSGNQDGIVSSSSSSTLPGKLSGLDLEDGKYGGSTGSTGMKTVVFTALPDYTNNVLVYNNGTTNILLVPSPISSNPSYTYWNVTNSRYEIPNFNTSNFYVFLKNNGIFSFSFNYAWKDAAGMMGNTATYSASINAALPMKLLYFGAEALNNNVSLKWVTTNEYNIENYQIERSDDSKSWTKVNDNAPTNSYSEISTYSANDKINQNEVVYYRLKEIDFDGSVFYSKEVSVSNMTAKINLTVYPNPAVNNEILNIVFDNKNHASVTIKLTDISGKVKIEKTVLPESNFIPVELTNLGAGVYFLTVSNTIFSKTTKISVR